MSTIGFERRFNAALQIPDQDAFVRFAVDGLPPEPPTFAANRRQNLGEE